MCIKQNEIDSFSKKTDSIFLMPVDDSYNSFYKEFNNLMKESRLNTYKIFQNSNEKIKCEIKETAKTPEKNEEDFNSNKILEYLLSSSVKLSQKKKSRFFEEDKSMNARYFSKIKEEEKNFLANSSLLNKHKKMEISSDKKSNFKEKIINIEIDDSFNKKFNSSKIEEDELINQLLEEDEFYSNAFRIIDDYAKKEEQIKKEKENQPKKKLTDLIFKEKIQETKNSVSNQFLVYSILTTPIVAPKRHENVYLLNRLNPLLKGERKTSENLSVNSGDSTASNNEEVKHPIKTKTNKGNASILLLGKQKNQIIKGKNFKVK